MHSAPLLAILTLALLIAALALWQMGQLVLAELLP